LLWAIASPTAATYNQTAPPETPNRFVRQQITYIFLVNSFENFLFRFEYLSVLTATHLDRQLTNLHSYLTLLIDTRVLGLTVLIVNHFNNSRQPTNPSRNHTHRILPKRDNIVR